MPALRSISTALGVAAALSLLSYGVGVLVFQAHISYVLHFGVLLVVVLGRQLIAGLRPNGRRAPMVREEIAAPELLVPDRPFARARRWEERLDLVQGDASYFRHSVVPALGDLIDERLRLTHGINRATDPERARQILGERLWSALEAEAGRHPPSRAELLEVIREMETLWSKHQ